MVRLLVLIAVVSTALACAPSSAPTPAPPSGGGGGGGAATIKATDADDQIPTGSNPEQLNSNNEQYQIRRVIRFLEPDGFCGLARIPSRVDLALHCCWDRPTPKGYKIAKNGMVGGCAHPLTCDAEEPPKQGGDSKAGRRANTG
uniref:Secreted protein n=1 Tax=Angiostrongylus cantonensis TaxID=6313 RepID=A0A158PBX6_ANGCA